MNPEEFRAFLAEKGHEHWRDMPWRADTQPYYVLVSELMLQQTQVSRVIPKFESFITKFPDVTSLASAPLSDVLSLWQGLGYNRRAKFLHESAKAVVELYYGEFPEDTAQLQTLPGVGKNTAGALMAYAFNRPAMFIETNIRTVYIHHYFADDTDIDDKQLLEVLHQTMDTEHPREFYWALMDYGSWLKGQGIRNTARSRHYKKQAPLSGSVREMRGRIVKVLSSGPHEETALLELVVADSRFETALDGLKRDGLIESDGSRWRLTQ